MDPINENMSDAGALPASAENAYVVDVTTESFMADVIDASQGDVL